MLSPYMLCAALCLLSAPLSSESVNGANRTALSPEQQALKAFLQHSLLEQHHFADAYDATVWYTAMSERLRKFLPDQEQRLALLRLVHREARAVNLPPNIVLAVIEVESAFRRFALSPVGAQGLMQVMPFWKNELGRKNDNLFEVETNLRYGCRILAFYLERENGNWPRALGRYNGSLGSMRYPNKVMRAYRQHWNAGDL